MLCRLPVEGNTVRVAGTRAQCGVAGIYAWSCDETLVQFNEISGVQGYKNIDGMGYDSDFNCRNNLFQYNYSHDNAGGFMGVFAGGAGFTAEFGNVGNQGTIIRYNVSRNDGRVSRAIFYHVAGGAKNAQIYNNTFFVGEGLDIHTFSESLSPEYHVRNNLFYVQGALSFSLPIQGTFSHNALFGKITDPPFNPDGLRVTRSCRAGNRRRRPRQPRRLSVKARFAVHRRRRLDRGQRGARLLGKPVSARNGPTSAPIAHEVSIDQTRIARSPSERRANVDTRRSASPNRPMLAAKERN